MIDAAAIRPILAGLNMAPLASMARLNGGSAEVFRLDLEDGTALVLKTYQREEMLPHREAHASSLLAGSEVPHTQYLLIDESRTRLPERYALTTYIAGTVGSEFILHPAHEDLFRGIGGLARRLHAIELPGFGELPALPYSTNASYVRALAEHAFEKFLYYGAEPGLAETLRELFDRDFDGIVLAGDRAVFAHDDLHPGNVLVTRQEAGLSIAGLVDFGNARASTAVMDLAKTIFICEHEKPGSGEAIRRGYGPIGHPEPEKALAFYTLLHRVIMWWWLRHIGVLKTLDAENDIMPALRETAANG